MAGSEIRNVEVNKPSLLSREQEALLDMYLKKLNTYFEDLKQSEKLQVEIETLHLKRILTK